LPEIIKTFEEKWKIRVIEPLPLSYNFVALAKKTDGTPVVLKIGFPKDKDLIAEIEVLKMYGGEGMVKLLDADEENGAFLEEHIYPGKTLASIENEEKATSIAVGVIKKITKEVSRDSIFPTVNDWWENALAKHLILFGGLGPIPKDLFDKAQRIFTEYGEKQNKQILLHGDLHHFNILSSGDTAWVAIDPQGVIGELAYETGAYLRNPQPTLLKMPNVKDILKERIHIFAEELSLEKERIYHWAIAQAVLSAMWDLENNLHTTSNYFIEFARLLEGIDVL
jgi:streptomycin 6-kinase